MVDVMTTAANIEFRKVSKDFKIIYVKGVKKGALHRIYVCKTQFRDKGYNWSLTLDGRTVDSGSLDRMKRIATHKLTEVQ